MTLLGLFASVFLYEYKYNVAGEAHPITSNVEFFIYLAGAIALSVEACKAAGNGDRSVILDQLASLLVGLSVLVFFVVGYNQIYIQPEFRLIPARLEGIFRYKPFLFSSLVVWLDVLNGFIIGRYNRSR